MCRAHLVYRRVVFSLSPFPVRVPIYLRTRRVPLGTPPEQSSTLLQYNHPPVLVGGPLTLLTWVWRQVAQCSDPRGSGQLLVSPLALDLLTGGGAELPLHPPRHISGILQME